MDKRVFSATTPGVKLSIACFGTTGVRVLTDFKLFVVFVEP
jgi:hypothetical protein